MVRTRPGEPSRPDWLFFSNYIYFISKPSDNCFISFRSANIAIKLGIETSATTTYAIFQTTVVSITAAKIKHKT